MDYSIFVTIDELEIVNQCVSETKMKVVLENCEQNYDNIIQLLTHLSIQKSDIEALQFLVETKGADIINDFIPLVYACQYRETEIFTYLVSKGANVLSQMLGFMILSCMSNAFDIFKIIFDMCEKDESELREIKDTLLFLCAMSNHYNAVKFLIDFGADPYTNDNAILKNACLNNDIYLLELYVELNLRIDYNGHLHLPCASSRGHTQIIEMLVEHGVDPKVFHLSAFVAAIESNNIDSLKFLFRILEEKSMELSENEMQFLIKKCEPCSPIAMYLFQKCNFPFETQFPFDIEISKECPVCLEDATLILPCRHSICSSCLISLQDKLCPFCRLQFDSNFIKRMRIN